MSFLSVETVKQSLYLPSLHCLLSMAFKKTLAERLFNISKISSQTLKNCRISSSSVQARISQNPSKSAIAPDPGDNGIFCRFIHKRAIFQPEISAELRSLPSFANLKEKLKEFDTAKDRIRLDGLIPPPKTAAETEGLTIKDVKKLLRVAQLEMVKSRLGEIERSWIPYSEFVRVCGEGCSDPEQGPQFAKMLDDSGAVIVLGNFVFLRPEEVTNAIGGLIPLPISNRKDPRSKELEQLETQKAAIDKRADSLVRRELWCGLAYLVVQTLGFMRLTFWELSWDVMEPICFYVTSIYFMAGYAFFLRTSKEPSFEGFYQSRFSSKQKRLIQVHNFDIERYNELRNALHRNVPSKHDSVHRTEKTNFAVVDH